MVLDLPLVDWRERFNGCQVIGVLWLPLLVSGGVVVVLLVGSHCYIIRG